jgi:hypothetical protein
VITVEAQHEGARPEIAAALADLLALLEAYAGGQVISAILGTQRSELSDE